MSVKSHKKDILRTFKTKNKKVIIFSKEVLTNVKTYDKIRVQNLKEAIKMACKCLSCGHIFDEVEAYKWEEPHGLDNPPYERIEGCPICRGAFEKTQKCKICGGEFLKKELFGEGICNECIDNYRNDFESCYNLSKDQKENVEISILLITLLGEEKIEKILYHYLKCQDSVDCGKFIDEDREWFADKLAEEVKK